MFSQVSGSISNTGHSVMFTVDNTTRHHINVTGGPLSYKYQFQEIHVHYGLRDDGGSEHSINGYAFPAEVRASRHLQYFSEYCAPSLRICSEFNATENLERS